MGASEKIMFKQVKKTEFSDSEGNRKMLERAKENCVRTGDGGASKEKTRERGIFSLLTPPVFARPHYLRAQNKLGHLLGIYDMYPVYY